MNLNEFALMCFQTKRYILLGFKSLGVGAVSGHPTRGAMKKHDDKCLKFMKSNNWLTLAPFAGVLVGKFSPNSQCNLILPILGIALGIGLRESRETP